MPAMPAPEVQDRKLTIEDFLQFPDDGLRHEVLDGAHVVSPAPVVKHQRTVGRLEFAFRRFLQDHPLGEVFDSPIGVEIGPHDILQPDLLFVSRGQMHRVGETHIQGPPDLVVEVLSQDKRRDVIHKRARYQAAGIPEYWLVDPELESVEVLRLDEAGVYQTALRLAVHTGGGVVEAPQLPGLAIDLAEVFAAPF